MDTKLDIVNHLLRVVGERKVNNLDSGHPSVMQAIDALDSANLDFQGRGWWFNTNRRMKFLPNNIGEIVIPSNCLSISIADDIRQWANPTDKVRYARRGNKLYDSWENTFAINTFLYVDLVLLLDIEDMPQVATSYLKHKAAEDYFVDDDGDLNKAAKLHDRTVLAWHALKAKELQIQSVNALDSPAARELNYRIRGGGYSFNPTMPGGRYHG